MAIPSGALLLFFLQEILLSGRINDKVQKTDGSENQNVVGGAYNE